MKILPLFMLIACVAWQVCAQDEENRASKLKRPLVRGKPTTTTTTVAPQGEGDYDEEAEYAEDEQQEPSTEAPPSSTEGKKLVGSGVRPFRSNTDLLETLKKRRAQAAEAKLRAHSNSDAPAADSPVESAKSSYSKKRVNNSPAKEEDSEESTAPKPTRGRFGKRPATRSVQAEAEDEEAAAPAPAPRPGRTFARRPN